MSQRTHQQSPSLVGVGVTALIGVWLAVVLVAAPRVGLYYETLAAWLIVPPAGLIDAYCASHRGRASALLAVVATLVAVLVIGFAIVMPHATAV